MLLPAVIILLPTFVVLAAAMAPTAVAWCVDRAPRKHLAVSVGALNLCGSLVFVLDLWDRGHYLSVAFQVLGDPLGWLVALTAAAVGGAIYLAMPSLTASLVKIKEQARRAELTKLQKNLVEAWGDDVAA
ncbi:MAG: hypothetical protein WEC41_05360, partial [Dongiaceae bacterium]